MRNYGPNVGTKADYAQMVEHVDRRVSEIMRSLEQHGLAAETLVVFMDDNGGERLSNNAPLAGGKGTLWDGGIRVPCVIRWPGVVQPGTVSHQATMTMDLTAMILSACGVSPPADRKLDGEDLMPIFAGKAPERSGTLFWRIRHPAAPNSQKAVRRGKWKFLTDERVGLLFDLEADPGETHDLAADNPKIVGELKKTLAEWEKTVPPPRALSPLR